MILRAKFTFRVALLVLAGVAIFIPVLLLLAQTEADYNDQSDFIPPTHETAVSVRQEKVKEMMDHAWGGYFKYAAGSDELNSTYKEPFNWHEPDTLLLTPVDAYDTLLLMGMKAEADQAKDLLFRLLKFDIDRTVDVFECTIRVLGGILGAFEADGDRKWLPLATDLADRLLYAFNTSSGLPAHMLNLKTYP